MQPFPDDKEQKLLNSNWCFDFKSCLLLLSLFFFFFSLFSFFLFFFLFFCGLHVHTASSITNSWQRKIIQVSLPFGACWSLMVSAVVLICPEIPGGGVWEHIDEEYVCLWGLDAFKGVYECSGHAWCRKCPILERLRKAKFHAPDTFEISKYQNLPI